MDLLAQMRTFVRVVEGKSLSAAARSHNLSLAAVSRQLSALESELGASLIVRSTRKLHITEAGHRWYAHCLRVLREVDDARASMRSSSDVQGSVVVSVSLTFGTAFVLPRLRALMTKHPRLAIDVRLEDQLVDLVGEGVDVAIRAGAPPPDSTAYVAQPLFAMERQLVAAPSWLKRHGVPTRPEQLAGAECLVQVTSAGNVVRWSLRRTGRGGVVDQRVIDVPSRVRTNAPLALRELALDGLGVAYLPDWLVSEDLEKGRLRRVLPEWSSVPGTAWAIYRSELRGAPRIRALLAALPTENPQGPRS
jgi:DNA-binding transcriptional LysR family regulator